MRVPGDAAAPAQVLGGCGPLGRRRRESDKRVRAANAALKINSSVPPFKFVISSQKKVCDYLRLRFNVAFLSVMINCSLENLDPKGGLFFNANIPTAGTVNGKRKLPDNGVKIQ